jgi:endo-1,4-beta-xylanase
MIFSLAFAFLAALTQSSIVHVQAANTTSTTSALNTLVKAAGKKYLGSATDNSELNDASYVAILKDPANFGQFTAGNSMKWVCLFLQSPAISKSTFTF